MQNIIVGTAGHVDHGKTCLIKALSGFDTDRLKEEKKRGITIDLGFANLPNDAGLHIGIIDVPGHEKFVKNMLAGIGGIDLVLMVVALDEGVMPQTTEHFEILRMLHIRRGILVLTKCRHCGRGVGWAGGGGCGGYGEGQLSGGGSRGAGILLHRREYPAAAGHDHSHGLRSGGQAGRRQSCFACRWTGCSPWRDSAPWSRARSRRER